MNEHAPYFFSNWYDIGRTATLSALAFLSLIVVLRASGKRTLSKMNVFDFVFVVAVGSLLAATIIEKDVALVEGLVSLLILVGLQTILAKLAAYSQRAERIINGEPALLFLRGEFIDDALKKERVTKEEVRGAIREKGVKRVEDVYAVVLENDGSLTVAWEADGPGASSVIDAKDPNDRKPAIADS